MKALILARRTQTWADPWAAAFAEGLARHGIAARFSDGFEPSDLLVIWGVRQQDLIARQRASGGEVCVLERSYLPDRFQWASVSFGGGLNGRGNFRGPFHDGSRFEKHFAHLMQPWRPKPDGYALVMEQVPGDNSVKGVDLPAFYRQAVAAFSEIGMEVRLRPHPQCSPKMGAAEIESAYRSLAEDLAGARCAVTWNSNAGVDAVLAGIPTVAMDEGSMAWDVTGHLLKLPPMPVRAPWAHALAWKQWSKEEIASGYCWDCVQPERIAA